MKAKEYVEKYQVQINEAATLLDLHSIVGELLLEFMEDSIAVGTKRAGGKKPNDRIMLPVVREFDLKWRAICNSITQLEPNAYIQMFRDRGANI